VTPGGKVSAKFVILAGAVGTKGAGKVKRSSVPATAYVIATEPLDGKTASAVFPADIALTEAMRVPDYYRLTSDKRLLFGANRAGKAKDGMDASLHEHLAATFPALKTARIDHFWHSRLDYTLNRLPHVGRLAPEIYFAHGFGGHGHGIICSNILGKILADAVAGQATRFDVFAKIRHLPFGPFRDPLFRLGMLWDSVYDAL
jgi:gamma-glutamylputrescine oxidase